MQRKESTVSDTYDVSGMSCEGCAKSVTRAIQAAAPQARVQVDLEKNTVTVEECADEAVIAQAVADAGFGFEGRVEG